MLTKYQVTKENSIKTSKNKTYKVAQFIFLVVYDDFEIFPFLYLYRQNKNIIIFTDNKTILTKYNLMVDVVCIDISLPKSFIFKEIKERISISV